MCRPRAFCPEDSGREYYSLPARRVAPQTPNSGSRTSAARLSHSCARKCKCKCMQRCGPQAQQRELLRIGSIGSLWRRCAVAPLRCTALHRAALRCGHSRHSAIRYWLRRSVLVLDGVLHILVGVLQVLDGVLPAADCPVHPFRALALFGRRGMGVAALGERSSTALKPCSVCAGTRAHLRRDSPTSAPGLAHICAGTRAHLRRDSPTGEKVDAWAAPVGLHVRDGGPSPVRSYLSAYSRVG